MSIPSNNPNSLIVAAAASYSEGQRVTARNSKEKVEKDNDLTRMLLSVKNAEKQKRANDANGTFLA